MKKIRKYLKNDCGFTLVEMVIVLFIISILSLIFIPNITNTKTGVEEDGKKALITIIQTQADLYEYRNNGRPTLDQLSEAKYITDGQKLKAEEWKIFEGVIK